MKLWKVEALFQIDNSSKLPIYEQLINQIREYILAGVLKPGDSLPTVRSLASQLSLNVNTIRKVYDSLELMGIISVQQGRGTFVTETSVEIVSQYVHKDLENFAKEVQIYKRSGISLEELLDVVRRSYNSD